MSRQAASLWVAGLLLLGCSRQDDFVGRVVYDSGTPDDGGTPHDAGSAPACDPAEALEGLGIRRAWLGLEENCVVPLPDLALIVIGANAETRFFEARVSSPFLENRLPTTSDCEGGGTYYLICYSFFFCIPVLCGEPCDRVASDIDALVRYACGDLTDAGPDSAWLDTVLSGP